MFLVAFVQLLAPKPCCSLASLLLSLSVWPPAYCQAGSSAAASAASSEDQQWNCGSCGTANFMWREFCGNCKRPCPNPYGSDKLSQTRKVGSAARQATVLLVLLVLLAVHAKGRRGCLACAHLLTTYTACA